jgi:hypothetical protein
MYVTRQGIVLSELSEMVTYRHGTEVIFQDEYKVAGGPPAVGAGILLSDGTRWRVVDVWLSYDKRGWYDIGWHAFVEPVEADDDRLHQLAPGYFSS